MRVHSIDRNQIVFTDMKLFFKSGIMAYGNNLLLIKTECSKLAAFLIIDAYNVIRTNPSLARFEKEKGTKSTISHFFNLCWKAMVEKDHWVVVFDGDGTPENRTDESKGIYLELFFSGTVKADDIIVDKARAGISQGQKITIASSDYGVYEPGVKKISSYDFYDILMSHPVSYEENFEFKKKSLDLKKIMAVLKKGEHLPGDFSLSDLLEKEIQDIIDDYGEFLADKANKAAKKIEAVLRKNTKVIPDPDPEKKVNRALKKIFREKSDKGE